MMLRRRVGIHERRGLGQTIPDPSGYTDLQSFLDAAAAANGVSVCRTGTFTGCPNIPLFQQTISQAEQAWFNKHPAPGTPGTVTSPVTGMTLVAPAPAPPSNVVSIAAPTQATTPAQVTAVAAPPSSAVAPPVVPSPAPSAVAPSLATVPALAPAATGFDLSTIPWWAWAGGAAALLFAFGGKR